VLRLLTACCILLSCWGGPALADPAKDLGSESAKDGDTSEGVFNKLLAPGPLMFAHRSLEHGACLKCHDAGKGVPDAKCLTCHSDIQQSIRKGKSFHGMTKQACISCHSDHKGRDLNSTAVNTKTFDHNKTGFILHGAHAKIKCVNCHTEKRGATMSRSSDPRFFGKTQTCNGCHRKDDIHAFPPQWAAKECSACHSDATWKGAEFDHKKATGYALIGDHAKIKCATCHLPKGKASAKYKFPELPKQQCLTCHADFHKNHLQGKFQGGNCLQCHSQGQETWKIAHFDHQITGFALLGKHQTTACVDCHKPPKGAKTDLKHANFTGLKNDCASCHKDFHGFRGETSPKLGVLAQCKTCHTEAGWKADLHFNHNTSTNYPIDGKHIGVKCFACHVPLVKGQKTPDTARKYAFPELASKTCETCHASPHLKESAVVFRKNKCSTCHTTQGWKSVNLNGSGFNHSTQTRFPLTGDHNQISCASCHLKNGKSVYKFANADKQFCVSCHATVHSNQFEPKLVTASCATCHDTVAFANLRYNHNESRFKITGAHEKLATDCVKCHKPSASMLPTKPPKPAGKYIFEHPQSGFCVDCHKNIHKEQFSPASASDNCLQCHNVKSFKDLSGFDHDKTRFKLVEAHAELKTNCAKCHVKTNQMLETTPPRPAAKFRFDGPGVEGSAGGFCLSCHKNVHIGQFDEEFAKRPCLSCHNQKTFGQRPTFDHSQTKFQIVGAHAKFKNNCGECHVKTNKLLATRPPKPANQFLFAFENRGYCDACHAKEHVKQFHPPLAGQVCTSCHNQNNFAKGLTFNHHNLARFDVKNKHVEVKCVECHTPTTATYKQSPHHAKGKFIFEGLLTKDCALCHKDPHAGRFGPKCSTCHTDAGWGATAGFHKDFVLTGVHRLLDCNQCHANNRQLSGTGDDCKICHQKDDVHLGAQPDCKSCHIQQFWSAPKFQHGMTDFPLRGAHRLLECGECHAHGVYQGKSSECVSCHLEDSVLVNFPNHKQAGFSQCETCHNQFQFRGKK